MKTIITLLLLSVTTLIFAQHVKQVEASKALTSKTQTFFKDYFSQIKAEKWVEVAENMPKGFLAVMSANDLAKQMEEAFNNTTFTTTFNEMTYKNISSAFLYEGVTYANVNYRNSFTFHFIKQEAQTDDEFNTYMDFMTSTFQNQFSDQSVARKKNGITIAGDKSIVVIDDPEVGALKMLELDKNMGEFYKMFLPEAVVAQLMK